ncbi:hypothetical protein RFI_02686 [Reticulomyxa filosa]|uniref:CAP-Gly domain-containing protein n=1 Tax=Reticulomyxa filosa TaxID=46433 RepID=X6P8I2_RETFI|nr:hypothetical protein RFI_02686 [Reticulomyxa filosa]|eukprot:ETO34408.1 hypothetical protein RFI_02686 [Reticulomyxa filosa]
MQIKDTKINTKLNINNVRSLDNNQRCECCRPNLTESLFKKKKKQQEITFVTFGRRRNYQQTGKEILIVTLTKEKKLKSIKLADVKQNLGKYQTPLQQELLKHLKVDDHVRLMRGRTGKVKYIGPVGDELEMIGIEMDSWNPSGHNGKGLFTAADNRGYFAKLSEII